MVSRTRVRAAAGATALMAVAWVGAGCGESGPSTEESVCAAYDDLGEALSRANGLFDNAVFHRAGDLGDEASRFEGDAAVQADGAALDSIADSDETSGLELQEASQNVAALCGGPPLGMTPMFGE
jgi:hypothetical protein